MFRMKDRAFEKQYCSMITWRAGAVEAVSLLIFPLRMLKSPRTTSDGGMDSKIEVTFSVEREGGRYIAVIEMLGSLTLI